MLRKARQSVKAVINTQKPMPFIRPTFMGFTVDSRLREFRRAIPGEVLELVDVDSERGQELLAMLREFFVDPILTELHGE